MLKITNLETTYKDIILALKGISLEVPPAKIVTLLGANGAGKTTTINTVSGIRKTLDLTLEDGTIEFDGEIINEKEPYDVVARGILQVPEGRRVFAELTVEENIIIGSYTLADRNKFSKEKNSVLAYFPVLKERGKQLAGYLSGGEQQMLVIARALMAEPKLIMMDEPSLGLAPLLVKEIFGIIGRITRKRDLWDYRSDQQRGEGVHSVGRAKCQCGVVYRPLWLYPRNRQDRHGRTERCLKRRQRYP
jgi:branched-chain amino acid transport system ATP-binding protein